MTHVRLRIGTRGSTLALAQTDETRRRLAAAHAELAAANAIESVVIRTTGDKVLDRPLAEVGGKGMFTKEIDEALLSEAVDVAVHSVKDLPTRLPDGLVLGAVLPREDPRDVLVWSTVGGLDALPAGATIGTVSLRRQAQVLNRRPDIRVVPMRGNVGTRLAKLRPGHIDATLLALAGLRRLGLTEVTATVVEPEEMLPAVGQGAIGIVCRTGDEKTRTWLAALDHGPSHARVRAERAMLGVLDGSCRTPIAGLAEAVPAGLWLRGLVASPDGIHVVTADREGSSADSEAMGTDLGHELRRRAGPNLLSFQG